MRMCIYNKGNHKEGCAFAIKEITKEQVRLLETRKIIRNSSRGYIDKRGNTVGFYRTRNKRYIEDRYADIAQKYSK